MGIDMRKFHAHKRTLLDDWYEQITRDSLINRIQWIAFYASIAYIAGIFLVALLGR